MKILKITFLLFLVGLSACSKSEQYPEFALKTTFSMNTDDYQVVSEKKTTFRPYLTPFAKIKKGKNTVLFGFIFFIEEYIQGVAYLLDSQNKVIDTLNVSVLDTPDELWAEIGDEIMLLESVGGMFDEGHLPPKEPSTDRVDTLHYRIGNTGFEKID